MARYKEPTSTPRKHTWKPGGVGWAATGKRAKVVDTTGFLSIACLQGKHGASYCRNGRCQCSCHLIEGRNRGTK